MYVVHLSTRLGLEEIRRAKAAGQGHIGAETCPSTCCWMEAVYADPAEGLKAVMAPTAAQARGPGSPLDSPGQGRVGHRRHRPLPFTFAAPEAAGAEDFWVPLRQAPGVEERLILLYSEGVVKGRITLPQLVKYACANPARIAGLYPRKGTLAPGADADLVILDPEAQWTLTTGRMHGNADYTCYEGMEITGAVERVLLRGGTIAHNGAFTGRRGDGQYLRRGRSSLIKP